jgi:hypothetical protein
VPQCAFLCYQNQLTSPAAVLPPLNAYFVDYSDNSLTDGVQLLNSMRDRGQERAVGVLDLGDNPSLWSKDNGLIPPGAFANFSQVFQLGIGQTGARHITQASLEGLDGLLVFLGAENRMEAVPEAALATYSQQLVNIKLDRNPFKVLDMRFFAEMPSLRFLSIQRIPLTEFRYSHSPEGTFDKLKGLWLSLTAVLIPANLVIAIQAASLIFRQLNQVEVFVYIGPGPHHFSVQTFPQKNTAVSLELAVFLTPQVNSMASLDPQVLLDFVDWHGIAGRLPAQSNLYSPKKPKLVVNIGSYIQCYAVFSGRRHFDHFIKPNNLTTPPLADGFPTARCDCQIPGEPQITGVSHCEPRQAPLTCAQNGQTYFPFQMADGTFDCPDGEDELYPFMRWGLKGTAVGHVPSEERSSRCDFLDFFPDDPDCNLDCMALMNATADKGVVHLTPVLPDGSRAGCASGSLCPTGTLLLVRPYVLQGSLGINTLRYDRKRDDGYEERS